VDERKRREPGDTRQTKMEIDTAQPAHACARQSVNRLHGAASGPEDMADDYGVTSHQQNRRQHNATHTRVADILRARKCAPSSQPESRPGDSRSRLAFGGVAQASELMGVQQRPWPWQCAGLGVRGAVGSCSETGGLGRVAATAGVDHQLERYHPANTTCRFWGIASALFPSAQVIANRKAVRRPVHSVSASLRLQQRRTEVFAPCGAAVFWCSPQPSGYTGEPWSGREPLADVRLHCRRQGGR